MVYGIIELINFAHFNVFMVGSFFGLWVLEATGLIGQRSTLTGLPLIGVLLLAFTCTMLLSGLLGIVIERTALRSVRQLRGTAPMILTIGISYVLYNVILLTVGADTHNFPNPIPVIKWQIGGAVLQLRELLVWSISPALMVGLHLFVRHTRIGKAMQATAQDQEAARMMGVEVDRVVIIAFFIGSALAGAAGLIFGLYYNFTGYSIGYSAGLRAFTAHRGRDARRPGDRSDREPWRTVHRGALDRRHHFLDPDPGSGLAADRIDGTLRPAEIIGSPHGRSFFSAVADAARHAVRADPAHPRSEAPSVAGDRSSRPRGALSADR